MLSLFFITLSTMIISKNQQNYRPQFKARKIAVARPIVDGIAKEIEIYNVSKKDKDIIEKIVQNLNLAKLLPSKVNAPNFNVWQNIIEATSDCIGNFGHQRIFLAVQDKKPCGLLLAMHNMKKAEVVTFATWPTAIEQKVKKAGSSLFTAFLNLAKQKKLKLVKLEPVINGPTDAVGFYRAHGLDFPDKYASVMIAPQERINATAIKKSEELNYTKLKRPVTVKLQNVLDLETN